MNMKMTVYALMLIPILAGCGACEGAGNTESADGRQKQKQLTIVSWNVEALFDGQDDGSEYEEYVADAGWTKEKYLARLTAIGNAVENMDKTPDILTLVETEKSQILEDLANGPLAKNGYRWTFFGGNPGASLGIGILSRYPFTQTVVHSLSDQGVTIPRPVLEVRLGVEGQPLVLFLCHWKSKLGGDAKTELLRRSAARIIARRMHEIQAEDAAPVIVMGDLNENYDEFYRVAQAYITALLPDDPSAAQFALANAGTAFTEEAAWPSQTDMPADFLVISPQKPPYAESFGGNTPALYSPWCNELKDGSYNYKNSWETIDHFLLNAPLFDNSGWDFVSADVLNKEPFVNAKGYPAAYNPRTGNGLSDHLPIMLTLRMIEGMIEGMIEDESPQ
jgi:endonuclease/exonuclease/phosphatase family metal-dependent hydrolase